MSDILLASGCSYTDKSYVSWDKDLPQNEKGGWDFWPDIVAKDLDLDVVNAGKRGRGNIYILEETLKALTKYGKRVKVLMILWSDIDRIFLPRWDYDVAIDAVLRLGKSHQIVDDEVWDFTQLIVNYFNRKENKILVDNHLANIRFLIDYCHLNNIKVVMAQGIGDINPDFLLSSEYFQSVEKVKRNVVGWPFTNKLNGYIMSDLIPPESRISVNDQHPNADGQKIIAEKFLEQYYKVYDKPQM